MAKNVWISSGSEDWTVGSNWSTGAAPVASDDVIFSDASTVDVTTGPATAIDYGSITVHEEYTGTIMSSGTKLLIGTVGEVRFGSRGGKLFLRVGDASESNTLTDLIVQTPAGLSDMLEVDVDTTCALTNLKMISTGGIVTITSGAATVSNIEMHNSPGAQLVISSDVGGLTDIKMDSGLILNSSVVTTGSARIIIVGGRFRHQYNGSTTPDLDEVMILGHDRQAIFEDQVAGTDATTLSTLYASGPGAFFDGRKCTKPTRTVTNSEGYNRARIWMRNSLDSYVLTTGFVDHQVDFDLELGGSVTKS